MKSEISIGDFEKLDIRVGKITAANKIPGAKTLMLLKVDIGEPEPRQLVAGLVGYYEPEELIGKYVVVLANLKPKKFMGFESKGMILAADEGGKPILLTVDKKVKPGCPVK